MIQKLSASYIISPYPISQNAPAIIDMNSYVEEVLQRRLMDELVKLLYEKNRSPITISPILITESWTEMGIVREHSLELGYARTLENYMLYPTPTPTILPPNLSWWKRLKFLFTNKIPK